MSRHPDKRPYGATVRLRFPWKQRLRLLWLGSLTISVVRDGHRWAVREVRMDRWHDS